MLREVKYLEMRGIEEIPESAGSFYSKNDTLRQYIQNLDLTILWYNKVRIVASTFEMHQCKPCSDIHARVPSIVWQLPKFRCLYCYIYLPIIFEYRMEY